VYKPQRQNISDTVIDELRTRIVRGDFPAGERINEVHVSQQLQVSRTPLREALTRLAGESFIDTRPKLGFFVRPLTVDEATDLYAIRVQLDPWALRLAGIPSKAAIVELVQMNEGLGKQSNLEEMIDLDDTFHLTLLGGCPNRTLLELIRQMMWRTRRYELAYFSDPANRYTAAAEHAQLITKLRRNDLDGAVKWLTQNMSSALPALVKWLEARK
jgi:DNA-binding GntR family transcriptional regulator